MSDIQHLLHPTRLLAVTYDVGNDLVIIEAETGVGTLQIDLHELHGYEGDAMLNYFSAEERRCIEAFQSAAMKGFHHE